MSELVEVLEAERRRLAALLTAVDALLEAHGVDGTRPRDPAPTGQRTATGARASALQVRRRGPAKVTCEFCHREMDPRGLKTHQRKCRKEHRRGQKPLSGRTTITPQACPMCGRTTRTNPCEHCNVKIAPAAVKA